jgi:hypothetical protein
MLSAGCGSGTDAAVRQATKQWFGDGSPKILRVDTVHDLSGTKEIIATVEGRFKLRPHCVPGARCRAAPPFHYAWVSFSDPKGSGGEAPTNASQIAAIDNAHSARPMFSILPDFLDTAIQCAIPKGISSRTIDGSCSTVVAAGRFDRPREIRFHEAWKFAPTSLGYRRQKADGGWIVSLDQNGRVQSIHQFGDLPPQLWK